MSQHDDPFQELGRTLDVMPSRGFADGVRSRIARHRRTTRATMSGLAIAASVVLVAVAKWPGPAPSPVARPADKLPVTAASNAPAPAVPAMATSVRPALATRRPLEVTPAAGPDRLQVVTNQMAVLRAIWAGQQVTAAETEAPVVETLLPRDAAPVVIEPVRVVPVVIGDHRTPAEGLPIIRRAVAALETK